MKNYGIWKLFISWYNGLTEKIVWNVIIWDNKFQIDYILDNYKLKKDTLNYLKENIEKYENIDWSFEKAMIYEYNWVKIWLSNINWNPFALWKVNRDLDRKKGNIIDNFFILENFSFLKISSLIFFEKDYFKNINKNIYYYWKEYNNWTFCKLIEKSNNIDLISKKNSMFNVFWKITCWSFRWYDEEFKEIQKQEKLILKKIDKQLKEIKDKEEKQKINPKVLNFFKK